jgi:hypothetical protein
MTSAKTRAARLAAVLLVTAGGLVQGHPWHRRRGPLTFSYERDGRP